MKTVMNGFQKRTKLPHHIQIKENGHNGKEGEVNPSSTEGFTTDGVQIDSIYDLLFQTT
jgi:hypothetical protein